ncbi:mitochondrial 54S ribosomal protein IMG1 [Coccidioides immitis RS]|uniref:Ribosomal protein L19 n=4 Tax=Coccidioides immitis TaxID=5501 RepID=J3K8H7_COCIM|nr:mitochondrial 54S ribosomal protein IMG1 [Coccidioides immitis RS]KMP03733.1 hypothetical protein CIRG_03424 [Coccidioides immitis RMSCC 2394]KMU74705.1 hypothetical protein CISG_00634 [Coccidioides immitis RMSCC 3703]KMU83232.1 hypothetical protein CIHG_01013 [Coccidioides immitis H538.4]TPX23975.1 hypothetical protein DIZ76_013318 [Coccidioides immitis]EAS31124.3 ribosomal protein L19 [Coccidioides immitis RS]
MASLQSAMRPLGCWNSISRELGKFQSHRRFLTTVYSAPKQRLPFPENLPEQFHSQLPKAFRPGKVAKKLKVLPPPPSPASTYKDPIASFTKDQLAVLDPTGERQNLFNKRNRQGAKVGDILRVTFKSGDPFAGVCLNIRQRGIDTAFLLRNQLTRVGCEMWIKVYNPQVQAVEIVQRSEKRKRRARLTYMRQTKHDFGTVEGVVQKYLREKAILSGETSRTKTRK